MTIRYVNTASTAGGNGTTNATTGANRAYASQPELEAAEQITLTDNWTIECCGAAADTAVTYDGWTMGSFSITVRGNPSDANGKHAGVYSTSKYRVEANSGTAAAITPIEENMIIRDLIARNLNTGGTGIGRLAVVGNDLQILNNIIYGAGASGGGVGIGLQDTGNLRAKAKNNIVYNWDYGIYCRQDAASTGDSLLINNTVTKCGLGGIRGRGSFPPQCHNNIVAFNTTDWTGSFSSTASHNTFTNNGATCPGTTDIDLSTYAATDLFVDNTNNNFHLLSSGSAYALVDNEGVGPSSNTDVTTDDIDGDTRSGTTTSVGADIIIAAGGTVTHLVGSSLLNSRLTRSILI